MQSYRESIPRSHILLVLIALFKPWTVVVPKNTDPSSTLLRMHKYYTLFPPHETSLYDTLHVLPNATAAEITNQYRRLSRKYHPDKRRKYHREHNHTVHNGNETRKSLGNTGDEETEYQERLFQVRSAYEILKQDTTRLTYHRFGLFDTGTAAAILTGGKCGQHVHISPLQARLMELMGYTQETIYRTSRYDDHHLHSMRVMWIAIHLVELIRPLVEGLLSQNHLAHEIAKECDALKALPLGAHILRCIGRAYRLCGQRYLRRHRVSTTNHLLQTMNHGSSTRPLHLATLDLTDSLQVKLRDAKNYATAAIASGRLILEESVYSFRKSQKRSSKNRLIQYADLGNISSLDELKCGDFYDGDDMRETEEEKAHQAVITSLQVEALWKIAKIDLDKTIQEACQVILQGEYFFFPSHQCTWARLNDLPVEGWVASSSGQVIDASIGKLRAAAALILVGDVMVRSSKDRTSWVD